MKRFLMCFLCAGIVLSSFGTAAASDDTDERLVYQSSENFSISSDDGTWDGGVWAAKMVDPETDEVIAITETVELRDGMGADAEQASAFQASAGGQAVSAYRIMPAPRNNVDNFTYNAAKVFTAPKDGSVIISCGGDKIQTTDGSGPSVRIRKMSDGSFTQVWPSSGSQKLGWADFNGKHDDIRLTIKKGEKIYFEGLRNPNGRDHMWSFIYWDPKVTYQSGGDEPDVPIDDDKTEYLASDSFSLTRNGDSNWKWQYYSIEDKEYRDLEFTHSQLPLFGKDDENAPAWTSLDTSNRGVSVGAYGMRCSVIPDTATSEEQTMKIARDYAVRTFTATKRGEVTIGAEGDTIHCYDTNNGTYLRIMQYVAETGETKQLWPSESWENVAGYYNFEPIEVSVNFGDKITFENAFWWKRMGASPWNTAIHWNPRIKYEKVYPILMKVSTENGAVDVPLNNEFVLSYDKAINSVNAENVSVFVKNTDGETVAADGVSAETVTDGKDLTVKFSGLVPYTEYSAEVGGIGYVEGDGSATVEKFSFTTGPEVNTEEITYENGTVTAMINNPSGEPKRAALLVLVCRGTESLYTAERAYYSQRSDIGANDKLEIKVDLPAGCFIKAVIMNGIGEAKPYRKVCIIGKGE